MVGGQVGFGVAVSNHAGILEVDILVAVSGRRSGGIQQITGRLFLGFLHCWLRLGFAAAF